MLARAAMLWPSYLMHQMGGQGHWQHSLSQSGCMMPWVLRNGTPSLTLYQMVSWYQGPAAGAPCSHVLASHGLTFARGLMYTSKRLSSWGGTSAGLPSCSHA
jgi:hypothetical protein